MTTKNVRRTPAPAEGVRGIGRALISGVIMGALLVASVSPAYAEVDAVARGLAVKGAASASPATITGAAVVAAPGDSLTAGNEDGSGVTWPNAFAGLTNYQVLNLGIGGQTSTQILMRVGGIPFTLTFSGNTITAFVANSVTAINGNAIVSMSSNSAAAQPLSTAAGNTTYTITGTVCGVHGQLVRTGSGGPPSTSESYVFYGDSGTSAATCAANSAFTNDNTQLLKNSLVAIWAGRNNFSSPSQVQTDIATTVATLGHQNYLILGVTNGAYPSEWVGQTNYNTILSLNSSLATTYGSHYIDTRAAILAAASNSAIDQTDVANGVPPYSLRAVDGSGTLTSSVGTTGCPAFTVSTGGQPYVGSVELVDSEYIMPTHVTGGIADVCTRGFGGSTAATHGAGAAYTLTDTVHFGAAGYQVVAQTVNSKISTLRPSRATLTTDNVADIAKGVLASPPPIGGTTPNSAVFTTVTTSGNYKVQNGLGSSVSLLQPGISQGSAGVNFWYGGQGGTNINSHCFEVGGSGGTGDPVCIDKSGQLAQRRGIVDLGYAYSQPTTGGTVTISDTGDAAVIDPAGTLASLTVNLPRCAASSGALPNNDGKIAWFSTTQALTALTVASTSGSIANGAPTSATAGQGFRFICRQSNTTWYRIN